VRFAWLQSLISRRLLERRRRPISPGAKVRYSSSYSILSRRLRVLHETMPEITQLLLDWSNGNKEALDELTPLVYSELHRIAGVYLRREYRSDHTLQPTALINEAYLRLVDQKSPEWKSRAHFFGVAAHLMRQILVDHARGRLSAKRGGGIQKLSLDDVMVYSEDHSADMLVLDDALRKLAEIDERKCRIIEMRFFGGLTLEEMSEVLGVSVATLSRDLRLAHAWLQRELSGQSSAVAGQ
jgi:RNA polymerase sigma factor (TIGR02999 family)